MTTDFDTIESSRSRGAPNTLYKFSYLDQKFTYTDAEQPITFLGDEYTPIPIDRTSVAISGTLDKSTLTITLPSDNDVVELFRVYPPSGIVAVSVFQGHAEYGVDFKAVWIGRVLSCGRTDHTATITAEPVSTSMRRPGLRRRFQYGCPHALYGSQCKLAREDFTVTTTVDSLVTASLTLASGWNGSFDKANFVDGIVEWSPAGGQTQLRSILQVNAGTDTVVITGQMSGLTAGQTVKVSLGCNHQMSGCNTFNNILNYGGQPDIPTKNPVGVVNPYY